MGNVDLHTCTRVILMKDEMQDRKQPAWPHYLHRHEGAGIMRSLTSVPHVQIHAPNTTLLRCSSPTSCRIQQFAERHFQIIGESELPEPMCLVGSLAGCLAMQGSRKDTASDPEHRVKIHSAWMLHNILKIDPCGNNNRHYVSWLYLIPINQCTVQPGSAWLLNQKVLTDCPRWLWLFTHGSCSTKRIFGSGRTSEGKNLFS